MTSGSGVTSGGGGGGAGGALTGVVDSGVSKASSESELLGSFLARCWGEAVGVTSTPGPAAEGAEAVCSGAKGAGLARAADGEALNPHWPCLLPACLSSGQTLSHRNFQ